jgi:hypothetical protein
MVSVLRDLRHEGHDVRDGLRKTSVPWRTVESLRASLSYIVEIKLGKWLVSHIISGLEKN